MEKLWKSYGISFLVICTNPERMDYLVVERDLAIMIELMLYLRQLMGILVFKLKDI